MVETKKKILVVDDHFDMLEFLRSMLELSNADYQVTGVPSAEEGMLELHRTPYDLLITDVRLPGMSGFELVRKTRRLQAELPILMITAYASAQGREEAEQLGVYRYFEKPLDTDALLAAVDATVYKKMGAKARDTTPFARAQGQARKEERPQLLLPQQEQPSSEAMQMAPQTVAPKQAGAPAGGAEEEVVRRLGALLSDTGAVEALLADGDGGILYRAGSSDQPVTRLARLLARSLRDSFELAEALQSAEPFTIQYQTGARADVYGANIGRDYFLILLFDARARRGRIGTVWVFAQRAVKELRELLAEAQAAVVVEAAPAPRADVAQVTQESENKVAEDAAPARTEREPEAGEHEALFDLLERAAGEEVVDLDGFWEDAAADAGGSGRGLTYEEAVRQGLLPPDLKG